MTPTVHCHSLTSPLHLSGRACNSLEMPSRIAIISLVRCETSATVCLQNYVQSPFDTPCLFCNALLGS